MNTKIVNSFDSKQVHKILFGLGKALVDISILTHTKYTLPISFHKHNSENRRTLKKIK